MLSLPLRRSSPGPGMPASTHRVSSPSPSPTSHPNESTRESSRSSRKRQATAPMPLSSTTLTKKKRNAITSSKDEQSPWSDNMHSAFLEALLKHPPISAWRFDSSVLDAGGDDQVDYYRIIQDYILKKTGRPHSVENISEHLSVAFPDPLATPLIETPHTETSTRSASLTAESSHVGPYPSYISQLHEGAGPHAIADAPDTSGVKSASMRTSESPSMSRRRKACNRPTLDLRVDIPPVLDSLLDIEACVAFDCGSASFGLTPTTASLRTLTTPAALEDGLNPSTPAEQCHRGPLVPPEMPRLIDVRRNIAGRWIPTPTEGVLPSLSYASGNTSSCSLSSFESSSNSESCSNDSTQSNETGRTQSRPKMSKRGLSWLSMPKHVTLAHFNSSALASPIASSIGASEVVASSPLIHCDNQTLKLE